MDLMIDLETLGKEADSVVLSIGAVFFDTKTKTIGEKFYAVLDIDDQIKKGRQVDGSTIKWWMQQSDEARSAAFKNGNDVKEVLTAFNQFIEKSKGKTVAWGNGSTFDISMIEDLLKQYNIKTPWLYYNVMDFRTFRKYKADNKKVEMPEDAKHNALEDALAQAKFVLEHL